MEICEHNMPNNTFTYYKKKNLNYEIVLPNI